MSARTPHHSQSRRCTRTICPARKARESAGLTLAKAAKRARVAPKYLAWVERNGACYGLASRLSRVYSCRIDLFLPTKATNDETTHDGQSTIRR